MQVDSKILEAEEDHRFDLSHTNLIISNAGIHDFKLKGTWEFLGFVDSGINSVAIVSDHSKTGKLNFSQIDSIDGEVINLTEQGTGNINEVRGPVKDLRSVIKIDESKRSGVY